MPPGSVGALARRRRFAFSLRAATAVLLFSGSALSAVASEPPPAAFTVDGTEERTVGEIEVDFLAIDVPHVGLSWGLPENGNGGAAGMVYQLEQADSAEFSSPTPLYEGRDQASFRGGLPEGDVFYRIRTVDEDGNAGDWSRPLLVRVEYQSMTRAVALFAIGGVVVLSTVILVVAGGRKDREAARREEGST